MATSASRPSLFAAARRARAFRHTWIAIPLGLAGLIALSLTLRTAELGIGFWIDEGLSVGIADRPLTDIPAALRKDGSPPLYYMLLHFWLGLAGDSEEGVRSFSLACALLAIPVAWWAGRTVWGTQKAGWFAAVLMAFNPFLSQYAQEARMYAMVALLAIPATVCFLRAYALDTDNRRPWIIGFAVSEALALYTHNWPIFFGAAAGVAWLVLLGLSDRRRELFKDGLWGFGGAAVLYLPWVPTTLYQAQHTGAPWADAPAFSSLLGVPGVILGRLPEIVFLICAGAGLIAILRTRPLSAHGRAAIALLIICVLTPTLAWLLSQSSPAWANRYLAVAIPPVPAARHRRARLRAPARRVRARAGRDHVGAGHVAGGEEQRPRDRPHDRPEPRPGRPGHLHPARDDPAAALLPARGPALRDADGRGDRLRRVGLA